MKTLNRIQNRILWAGILLFWGLVVFSGNIKFLDSKAQEKQQAVVHLPFKTVYNTIPDSENAIGLIAYELHEDGEYSDGADTYVTYSAVVKSIDSQKDNYRSLCKDVVSDVIKTCGNQRIVVNIYDSFEAYTLAMSQERQLKLLKQEEADTVSSHRVAVYEYASGQADANSYLTFYPDAKNGLTEQQIYSSL